MPRVPQVPGVLVHRVLLGCVGCLGARDIATLPGDGHKYMGIARTSYLIDGEGKVSGRNVNVDGHAGEVMNAVTDLAKA